MRSSLELKGKPEQPCGPKRPGYALNSALLRLLGFFEALNIYEALSDGIEDGLRSIVDVQLFVEVRDVVSDGLLGDAEVASDLLVTLTAGEGGYDLALALGEAWGGGLLVGLLESEEHLACDLRGHDRIASVHGPNGPGEVVGGAVLEEVARGACLYPLEDVYVVGVHGEDKDLGIGEEISDFARRRDAVHDGHAYVHKNDVRL